MNTILITNAIASTLAGAALIPIAVRRLRPRGKPAVRVLTIPRR